MNLTSKRMLQVIAGCAGAAALSATAQSPWVADDFEYLGESYGTTNGAVDMLVSAYKCQPYGTSNGDTNFLWFVESSDDLSKIVSDTSPYAGSVRPMAASTAQLALNLETNGKTLVRTNNASLDFGASPIYVDTLIKFTPSEDNPTITDPSVKAAVFLDANLHLWVYHGGTYVATDNTASDTGLVVSTNEWHRLTIMMSKMPESTSDYAFKVYIDQTEVSCAAGMQDNYDANGPWFYSASIEGSFAAVAFQGTGLVDELVVADTVNLGSPATWLTLAFNSAQVTVSTNGVEVAPDALVQDGAAVEINAKAWYEITNGGLLLTDATTNVLTGTTMITNLSGIVTGEANATNTIESGAYSQNTGISTGLGGGSLPADLVAAWAIQYGETVLTSDMLDDYLMDVDAGTNPTLYIDSITVDDTNATIVIKATGGVNFSNVNGIVNVWTSDDLVTFTSSGPTYVTVTTGSSITVVVPKSVGKFIKASVETADLTPE